MPSSLLTRTWRVILFSHFKRSVTNFFGQDETITRKTHAALPSEAGQYANKRVRAPGELSAMTDDDGRNADAGDADVRDSRCGF